MPKAGISSACFGVLLSCFVIGQLVHVTAINNLWFRVLYPTSVTGEKYILTPVKSQKKRPYFYSFISVHAAQRRSISHKLKKNNNKILTPSFQLKLKMRDIKRRLALVSDSAAKLPLGNTFSPTAVNQPYGSGAAGQN